MKRGWILVFFVLGFVLSGCAGEVRPEKVDSGSEAISEQKEETSYYPEFSVGDKIKLKDLVFVVHEAKVVEDEFFTPDPGNVFLAVDISVENIGNTPQTISSLGMLDLRDSEGRQYSQTILSGSFGRFGGEVAPGKKLRGTVAFEIPKDVRDLELMIEYSPFHSGQAIVKLSYN